MFSAAIPVQMKTTNRLGKALPNDKQKLKLQYFQETNKGLKITTEIPV